MRRREMPTVIATALVAVVVAEGGRQRTGSEDDVALMHNGHKRHGHPNRVFHREFRRDQSAGEKS